MKQIDECDNNSFSCELNKRDVRAREIIHKKKDDTHPANRTSSMKSLRNAGSSSAAERIPNESDDVQQDPSCYCIGRMLNYL